MQGKKTELTDLPENWQEMLLAIGDEGGTQIHMHHAMKFNRSTIERLIEEEPEFKSVWEEALRRSEVWWVNKAMEAFIEGKSKMFNQHLWAFIMKNRFNDNWKERNEVDVTSNGKEISSAPIQIEIIKSQDKNS